MAVPLIENNERSNKRNRDGQHRRFLPKCLFNLVQNENEENCDNVLYLWSPRINNRLKENRKKVVEEMRLGPRPTPDIVCLNAMHGQIGCFRR